MGSQRPFTDFLAWLIQEPERLERYHTDKGFQGLMEERGLPQELQEILRNNDLRAAMEVIKEETGGDNMIFYIAKYISD
jgi:hypothetical protein